MHSEENDSRINFLARTMPWYVQIFCLDNSHHGRVHEKRPKGTEETWILTEEQREQAKGRLKIVFLGVDRDKSGRIGFFGSSGGTSGFGLQIGTVPTGSGRLASMIMGHTSSPSIVGQFSISCQFRLVNALEVRFQSKKKLPSISETQRSFTAFSTFRKATKNNRSGPGFLFRFRPWRRLEFSSTQSVQRKTIAKVRIPNRARR